MFTAVKWTNPVLQDYEIVKMTGGRKEQTNVDRQVAISGKNICPWTHNEEKGL